jgi:hypothetical protein
MVPASGLFILFVTCDIANLSHGVVDFTVKLYDSIVIIKRSHHFLSVNLGSKAGTGLTEEH